MLVHRPVIYLLLIILAALVGACHEKEPFENPPPDTKPAIRRIAPVQASALAKVGEKVDLSYILTDNQQLALVEVKEYKLKNVRYEGNIMIAETLAVNTILSNPVQGTEVKFDYPYTVAPVDSFTRIDLWLHVKDNLGNRDSSLFIVTVDFERYDELEEHFSILKYTMPVKLYSQAVTPAESAYNLIALQYPTPTNIVAKDIQEISETPDVFLRQLSSPNNEMDSVFVVLRQDVFNYDTLSYSTMRQAFYANMPTQKTPVLQVGDIVILRMTIVNENYNNYHHFAALRIIDINLTENYITFEFKRSQNKQ